MPRPIPCPLDLDAVCQPGLLAGPLDVGVVVRLVRAAWGAEIPCTVPQCSLAAVAGVTDTEWAGLSPRLLLALAAAPHPGTAIPDLLVLTRARATYDQLSARARAVSAQRSAAGRGNRQADCQERPNGPSTGRQRAVDGPFERPVFEAGTGTVRALAPAPGALERSQSIHKSERSSAAEKTTFGKAEAAGGRVGGVGGIVGSIHAGLEGEATAKLERWRREQVIRLLGEHLHAAGRSDAGDLARRIAQYPHVTPAAAQIAIGRCEEAGASNPAAYLIAALGARKGGSPLTPYLSDQAVIDHWAKQRDKVWNAGITMAAVERAVLRVERSGQVAAASPQMAKCQMAK